MHLQWFPRVLASLFLSHLFISPSAGLGWEGSISCCQGGFWLVALCQVFPLGSLLCSLWAGCSVVCSGGGLHYRQLHPFSLLMQGWEASLGSAWVWGAAAGVHPGPLGCVDTPDHSYLWFIAEYALWDKKQCPLDHLRRGWMGSWRFRAGLICFNTWVSACPGAPSYLRHPHAGRTQECPKRHPKPGESLQGI